MILLPRRLRREIRRIARRVERVSSGPAGAEIHRRPFVRRGGVRIGRVVDSGPQGQADFDDSRYWVILYTVTNSDGSMTSPLVFAPEAGNRHVVATNLVEATYSKKQHEVRMGSFVLLHWEYDASPIPVSRWCFSEPVPEKGD